MAVVTVAAVTEDPSTRPAPPLVLTLALDPASQERMQALRDRHFPPERNIVPAHLTLFHALPGAEEAAVLAALVEEAGALAPMRLAVTGLRFLGRGVAYEVASAPLLALRASLAARWRDALTAQDSALYRPHVTIQNKADPAVARSLHGALLAEFTPFEMTGTGLLLWRYLGGPWERAGFAPFAGGDGR